MAENISIPGNSNKKEKYELLIPQLKSLVEGENDLIANLANLAAGIKYGMNFFWVGFYIVKAHELVLGPFQGPVACTRIKKGKGVCGKSWEDEKTIIVEDVDKFPGHIACNAASKSEIVLPLFDSQGKVVMVMDIDSEFIATFDKTDERYLLEIVKIIEKNIQRKANNNTMLYTF
ncbi:MAG: GAF domain-containing protein [Bacteroidetes bacterium]|nr:GAF domain-containing protein [Bacteroidota bacterium]HET6245402.1 GAF domain-containing protein [Bacteroidia bacterium]